MSPARVAQRRFLRRWDETVPHKLGEVVQFSSPYRALARHNGRLGCVIGVIEHEDADHDPNALPMIVLAYSDGSVVEAWPEEVWTR